MGGRARVRLRSGEPEGRVEHDEIPWGRKLDSLRLGRRRLITLLSRGTLTLRPMSSGTRGRGGLQGRTTWLTFHVPRT